MKRIVYMVTSGRPADGESSISPFVRSQAQSLLGAGWEVRFGLVDDRTSLRGVLRNARRLRREVASLQPAVVHAQYGSVISLLGRWASAGEPFVVSFCGADLLGSKNPGLYWLVRDFLVRRFSLRAAARADGIIVKSPNLLRALPKPLRSCAMVLPNGVDTAVFRPMAREECRLQLGWPAQAKIVVFNVSRYANMAVKNRPLAEAAMGHAKRSIPEAELKVLSDATHPQVAAALNAADCLLLTSHSEGSPNLVKEAMACNLPVVSVACGDVPERIANIHPGRVCGDSAEELGSAVVEVLGSGRRSNGREELERQALTANRVAAQLVELYARVQRQSPPAATAAGN